MRYRKILWGRVRLQADCLDVVKQLCEAGANVDALDGEGDTPVTVATRCGNTDALRLLCSARAKLDTAAPQGDENCGNTALQKAAHEEMASATP